MSKNQVCLPKETIMNNSDSLIKSEDIPKIVDESNITEEDARDMVYRGALATQYTLFKHARTQLPKVDRLAELIKTIEGELFSEGTLQQLEKGQLVKLYGLATHQLTDSIGFLERLHGMIQDTGDVVKITKSMSYEEGGSSRSMDSVRYRVKNSDTLRNVKDILIRNILGEEAELLEEK